MFAVMLLLASPTCKDDVQLVKERMMLMMVVYQVPTVNSSSTAAS
jgi:hypothetical protein